MKNLFIRVILAAMILNICGINNCFGQQYQKSLKQLTFAPGFDYYPSWSPDGKYIVFSTDRAGGNLWKVPSNGGTAVQVTKINSNHPSWSPEGSYIAFDSEQGSVVRIVSPDGGIAVRIVPESIKISRGAHPCWSRDGTKVTFTAEGTIWTVELASGKLTRIFHKEGYYARAFSWSPDGKYITADVGSVEKNDDDVWLLPVDGSEPVILTNFPGREGNPKYSPDGTMIAYMSDLGGKKELKIMSAKGGKSVKITTHEGFNANPRWSPDGTKLAFASDMGGNVDIWVMELNLELLKKALNLE
ncbi:TolB family protein [candidate division KSB1 bacterium]